MRERPEKFKNEATSQEPDTRGDETLRDEEGSLNEDDITSEVLDLTTVEGRKDLLKSAITLFREGYTLRTALGYTHPRSGYRKEEVEGNFPLRMQYLKLKKSIGAISEAAKRNEEISEERIAQIQSQYNALVKLRNRVEDFALSKGIDVANVLAQRNEVGMSNPESHEEAPSVEENNQDAPWKSRRIHPGKHIASPEEFELRTEVAERMKRQLEVSSVDRYALVQQIARLNAQMSELKGIDEKARKTLERMEKRLRRVESGSGSMSMREFKAMRSEIGQLRLLVKSIADSNLENEPQKEQDSALAEPMQAEAKVQSNQGGVSEQQAFAHAEDNEDQWKNSRYYPDYDLPKNVDPNTLRRIKKYKGSNLPPEKTEEKQDEPSEGDIDHTVSPEALPRDKSLVSEEFAQHLRKNGERLSERYEEFLKNETRTTTDASTEGKPTQQNLGDLELKQKPEPTPEPPLPPEKKAYEKRAESRKKWQQSKKLYEEAYAEYVGQRKSLADQFSGLFRKEEKPEKLRILESEYQDARRAYASSLNSALTGRYAEGTAREKKEIIEGPEGINAALANRFVLRAAQDKLALERERIPQGRAKKVFEDMQGFFKKNGKIIKVAGYVTAAGIGLTVGSFGYALTALAGKAATAKFVGGVSAASAFAANFGYDLAFLNRAEKERDRSAKRARYAYSEDRLDALENEYLDQYRTYENIVRNKRYVVAGAAIAGGVAAGIAAGNLDAEEIIHATPDLGPEPMPEVPPVHESAPEVQPEMKEVPDAEPGQPEPVAPIEPLTEEEIQMAEEKIQNEPKGGELKNLDTLEPEPEVITKYPFEEIDEIPYEHGYEGPHEEIPADLELEPVLHTFEAGDKIDTVSEALYESWKADPSVLSEQMTQKEFLADMYAAIAEIEKYPYTHAMLLEEMGITSGDLDKVQVGQTIDMRPFFEYLNNNR